MLDISSDQGQSEFCCSLRRKNFIPQPAFVCQAGSGSEQTGQTEKNMSEERVQNEIQECAEYAGEIVEAICEETTDKWIIARFKNTERVFIPTYEWHPAPKPGAKTIVYIETKSSNGLWAGSIEKTAAARVWYEIHQSFKTQADLDVEVVAADANGLICGVKTIIGYMPKREIEMSPSPNLESYIGKKFKARILKFSPTDAKLILSHKAAIAEQLLADKEELLAKLKPDQIYDGIVKQITDFGAFVDIGAGVEGLVHRSNLSWGNDDPSSVVSIGDKVKVIVISAEKGRIALGRKQLLKDAWTDILPSFKIGDIVEGKVTTFANFGAFVRLAENIEGLIHNTELSWDASIHQAKQILKLNDIVRVKILNIDEAKRRIALSLRQVDGNPWQIFADQTPAGTKLNLPIVSIADFGLFVDLGNGLRGLIHKNDVQWEQGRIELENMFKVGDHIDCILLSTDVTRERASLGIKQLSHDPWQTFLDKKPLGHQFEAVIQRIAKFGAFAAIEGVEGLIHISEISENRIENVGSILKVGQNVTVTVINIDENRHRIGLSMIADPFEPTVNTEEEHSTSDEQSAKIADIFPSALKKS